MAGCSTHLILINPLSDGLWIAVLWIGLDQIPVAQMRKRVRDLPKVTEFVKRDRAKIDLTASL